MSEKHRKNPFSPGTLKIEKVLIYPVLAVLLLAAGCANNMRNQPRYKPLAASKFFADGLSARPMVPQTVPNNRDIENEWIYTGKDAEGQPVDGFPFPVTEQVLQRGQERYDIFCAPCHSLTGDGQGMIVQRGFSAPPSFHSDRLRQAPPGHFVDVITNGFGQMYSYAYRIKPDDRWAIAAYIRALQLSQNATLDDVPPAERQKLEANP